MKILCQERYDKAIVYAKEIKNDTLQKCIDRLKQWEENPNCPCEIEIYYDSAPHSFGFRQVYPDGRTGIVGGLLYHGQPDQSFAVLMTPIHGPISLNIIVDNCLSPPTRLWSLHIAS